MSDDWPATIMGIPVARAPLGSSRSDGAVLPRTIAIIHDIEGSASSALGLFASPGPLGEGGGSTQFVADPDNKKFWQLCGANTATAYGCGNYVYNQRAIQIELPGVAGTPYDAEVLDYAARFLAWCNYNHGIPLTKLNLAALNGGALSGVCGHQDIPDPNNPAYGGGKDRHGDPGPTFPWDSVLAKARTYAGSPPLRGNVGDFGDIAGITWPTGCRIGGDFVRAWATGCGYIAGGTAPDIAAAIALFGYPVGRVFVDEWTTPHLVVQYFERARLEKHPDGSMTLGLIGAEQWQDRKAFLPEIASKPEG
jgi:hypothetical protein